MIVRSAGTIPTTVESGQFIPAFQAIAQVQKQHADRYWIVTQPDHAKLAGRVAASLDRGQVPMLTPDIVECIGAHDEGWQPFDGIAPEPQTPTVDSAGKPLAFTEMPPQVFLHAWGGSIARANGVSAVGGAVVSAHFSRIALHRLSRNIDSEADARSIREFLDHEAERRRDLIERGATPRKVDHLLEVLQFCDLMSLYICCGSRDSIEFPQNFGHGAIRLHRTHYGGRMDNSPFSSKPIYFSVPASEYPGEPAVPVTIDFEVSW